jgi:hypothetical protein
MPSIRSFAVALFLLPGLLAAQQTPADTTGFHAGQWALQFGAGFNVANLGILRFSSPRSAWMLLLDAHVEFLSGTSTDFNGVPSDAEDRTVFFAAGVGKRFYQAPRHKVRSFQSVGLVGSYSDQNQTFSGAVFKNTQWRAGLMGELGAGYWVTPNLSLGGTASVSGGYGKRISENSPRSSKTDGWFVSGVNVLLVFGLYF